MSSSFLPNSVRSKDPIANFFDNLQENKPSLWKTASSKDRFVYLTKLYSSLLLFKTRDRYYLFIGWITKYYPFSLLYRDRLIHHDNLIVKKFMIKIENIARKTSVKIFILNGKREEVMTEFIGYLDRKTKNRSGAITILETALQKEYQSIYVRDEGERVRILLPTEVFDEIINQK